jgi:hypothetical protein
MSSLFEAVSERSERYKRFLPSDARLRISYPPDSLLSPKGIRNFNFAALSKNFYIPEGGLMRKRSSLLHLREESESRGVLFRLNGCL